MAYGSPGSMEEVKDYYTNIRNGVPPDTDHLKTLENKYKAIGGVSPLLRTTMQQAHLLEEKLNSTPGSNFKVYVGMRHWRPFIHDAVKKAVESRANKFIALSLAPHYSEMTIGAYNKAAEDALKASGQEANAVYSKGWGSNHAFIEALAEKTSQALIRHKMKNPKILFTAHSLPEKILEYGDPYPTELKKTCMLLAERLGTKDWEFAYQSAGSTKDKWLGPDVLESLKALQALGRDEVMIVPIGFATDNLETLYDIDIEARHFAGSIGIKLERAECPNTSPTLINALEEVCNNILGR